MSKGDFEHVEQGFLCKHSCYSVGEMPINHFDLGQLSSDDDERRNKLYKVMQFLKNKLQFSYYLSLAKATIAKIVDEYCNTCLMGGIF